MCFCLEGTCLKQNNPHTNSLMEWKMRYIHTSPLSLHNPLAQLSFRLKFPHMWSEKGHNPAKGLYICFSRHVSETKHLSHGQCSRDGEGKRKTFLTRVQGCEALTMQESAGFKLNFEKRMLCNFFFVNSRKWVTTAHTYTFLYIIRNDTVNLL